MAMVGQTIDFRGLSVKGVLRDRRQKAIVCPTSDLLLEENVGNVGDVENSQGNDVVMAKKRI